VRESGSCVVGPWEHDVLPRPFYPKRSDVIIAAYARTLRPGVSLSQFIEAWRPEGEGDYPAQVEIGIDPANDRKVLTLIRVDGSLDDLRQRLPELVHPNSLARLDEVIESTELESVYVHQRVDI